MRMTGVRPEVGARLIHLPLSEMQFFAFGGAHFWVFPCQLCQPFQCFLGTGWPFQGPPLPISQVLDSKKTCVAGLGTQRIGDSAPPPKKWPFFVQKWPKNAIFVPKTVFFGLGWSVQLPPTLFRRYPSQKNMCCRVRDPENR